MSNKIFKFTNCRVLRGQNLIEESLWVQKGKIINPEKVFYEMKAKEDEIYDLKGNILSPGFIDLQVNGGHGFDFTHDIIAKPEGISVVAQKQLANGVTAFCPTLITSTPNTYKKVLPLLAPRPGGAEGAAILGAHVEGPYLNLLRRGAHQEEYISDFNDGIESVKKMYQHISSIKIITLDPEKPNSQEIIKYLSSQNILVSLGHTEADFVAAQIAVESGARMITHIFNAMRPFHHREPGVIGLLGSKFAPQIYYSIILDGTHVHASAIRFAYNAHPEGAIIISDSISAAGKKEGIFNVGNLQIEVKNKIAYLPNSDIVVSQNSSFIDCLRFFHKATACSTAAALEAASLHPARVLNIHHSKGSLDFDMDADFVVLTDNFEVKSTWIAGQRVYGQ